MFDSHRILISQPYFGSNRMSILTHLFKLGSCSQHMEGTITFTLEATITFALEQTITLTLEEISIIPSGII
jgi:hypothetical protein